MWIPLKTTVFPLGTVRSIFVYIVEISAVNTKQLENKEINFGKKYLNGRSLSGYKQRCILNDIRFVFPCNELVLSGWKCF